jgi:flagellar biosynthesis/type III secretory pathway protein FliH
MKPVEPEDRTEPVTQLTPLELFAGEVNLRVWPVRMGPQDFDRLTDLEAERERLNEAWNRLDAAREQARTEGLRLGVEEARDLNLERFSGQLQRHEEALSLLRQEFVSRVPGLASRLAEQMLGRELSSTPEALHDWVLHLLEGVLPATTVTLLHHPDDAGRFGEILVRAGTVFGHVRFLLREEDRVPPGEVILETPGLRVDARLASLSALWERDLEQVLHDSDPG